MRKTMVNLVLGMAALLMSGSAFGQAAPGGGDQPKQSPPPPAKPDKAAVPTLEEMLTRALKDNPDIRVAEAKVREADAELNRTRLLVTQKVIAFHRSLEAQKALVELAEKQFKRFQELGVQKAISRELLDEQQQKLTAAKARLAEVEAEMPYLLGKQPQPANPYLNLTLDLSNSLNYPMVWTELNQPMTNFRFTNEHFFRPLNVSDLNIMYGWQAASQAPAKPPVPGSMAEKIRKALDTQVSIEARDRPLGDLIEFLEAKDVPFRIVEIKDRPIASLRVNFKKMEDVSKGAVLQALEDTFPGLAFVVREYGILVTWSDKLPLGAMRAETFWKASKEKPKTPEGDTAKNNPPLEDVRGTILDIDAQAGLVSVSLGKDAGLQVGNTLEVYRLEPKPLYLGTLRLVDVKAQQAVAKPVAPLTAQAIHKGDRVASRVNTR